MRILHRRLDHDAAAFLRDKKKPTETEIKTALEGLKCRRGTHMGIIRAVIANAIFDAAGVHIRRVPFSPDRVKGALSS